MLSFFHGVHQFICSLLHTYMGHCIIYMNIHFWMYFIMPISSASVKIKSGDHTSFRFVAANDRFAWSTRYQSKQGHNSIAMSKQRQWVFARCLVLKATGTSMQTFCLRTWISSYHRYAKDSTRFQSRYILISTMADMAGRTVRDRNVPGETGQRHNILCPGSLHGSVGYIHDIA